MEVIVVFKTVENYYFQQIWYFIAMKQQNYVMVK